MHTKILEADTSSDDLSRLDERLASVSRGASAMGTSPAMRFWVEDDRRRKARVIEISSFVEAVAIPQALQDLGFRRAATHGHDETLGMHVFRHRR